MCGIAGIAGPGAGAYEQLDAMCRALVHRGPDDSGTYVERGQVALGFRRLEVIDPRRGQQPMADEHGEVRVTCNGEIYNFRKLRDDLCRRGHRFRSESDTEVLVHLYQERGAEFLHALEGMFAIALWDRRRRTLLLARDRFGVKPLYWAQLGDTLVYGSEPPAILASGLMSSGPDTTALVDYLTLQYVPPPRSGIAGIHKLSPAQLLRFAGGRAIVERWWEPPRPARPRRMTPELAIDAVDGLLGRATHARLVSDAPVGAFLSGGVDSSLVVSYMAAAMPGLHTFSVEFAEAGYGEGRHAQRVASLYGTEHHEELLEPVAVPAVTEAIARKGEPVGDSSVVPTYILSQAARRWVKVALSGDGGDEAFGGYRRYRLIALIDRVDRPLRLAGSVLGQPFARRAIGRGARRGRAVMLAQLPTDARFALVMSVFGPQELSRLCLPEMLDGGGAERVWRDTLTPPDTKGVSRYLALDVDTYLPHDILTKLDRASMAHGLEVRSPFVDYHLQEFAATLHPSLKLRGRRGKWVLEQLALRRGVPRANVLRRKQGFEMPIGVWFRTELKTWLWDVLLDPRTLGRGYFRPAEVEALLREHESGAGDHRARLWSLLMLEIWHRACIDA